MAASGHIHRFECPAPSATASMVPGVCACGATREFEAWGRGPGGFDSGSERRLICARPDCAKEFTTANPRKRYCETQCANREASRRQSHRRSAALADAAS